MAIGEVSTRSVPELDLTRGRFSRATRGYVAEPQTTSVWQDLVLECQDGVSTQPSPFLPFLIHHIGMQQIEHHLEGGVDMLRFDFSGSKKWQLIQYKPTGCDVKCASGVVAHVLIDDLASYVPWPTDVIGQPNRLPNPISIDPKATLSTMAFTNWLRLSAEGEPSSRPILDLDESRGFLADLVGSRKTKGTVSVSPGLRTETASAKVGGLGYVSAGLLLWLESSDEDDDDDDDNN